MARRPDVPCSGGCGRLLYGGKGALPPRLRTCLSCRAARRAERAPVAPPPLTARNCDQCGEPYVPKRSTRNQRFCGKQCLWTAKNRRRVPKLVLGALLEAPCGACGQVFSYVRTGTKPRRFCDSPECRRARSTAARIRGGGVQLHPERQSTPPLELSPPERKTVASNPNRRVPIRPSGRAGR